MVQVMLDLWKAKYGTSFYDIDTVTEQVYVNRDGKITAIPEKCSFKPMVGTEIMSTTLLGFRYGEIDSRNTAISTRTTWDTSCC